MRLLIAADIFPPESGGPATYAVTLANELMEQGVQVKIVSLNPDSDESKASCPLYKVRNHHKMLRYWQYFWLLFRETKGVDVVYAMGPVNTGLPALLAARLRSKKFVVKVVGDYAWEQGVVRFDVKDSVDDFQKENNYSFFVRLLKMVESFVVRQADKTIVPCNYLKNMMAGWGAEIGKIEVIYNAVDFKVVNPRSKNPNERWLVTVARMLPWKGIDTLIEIILDLKSEIFGLKLKIIGDGPEKIKLENRIKDLKLGNDVQILGNLSHEETLSYVSSADLFVLNSGYEGLSHVILEALYLNIPILASNIGGNPELLPQENLFTYNNKEEIINKISIVLKNKENFVINNKILEKFKFETMISNTKSVLEKICKC